jgi:uncharacterized protein YyaL (SSP411 family)
MSTGPSWRSPLVGLLLLALAIGAIWLWQTWPTPSAVTWLEADEEALARAKAEDRPVLVKFYLVGCGPCKAMDREVFADERIGAWVNRTCVPLTLDLQTDRRFSVRHGVESAPTLILLTPEGRTLAGPANPPGAGRLEWFEAFLKKGLERWQNRQAAGASRPAPREGNQTRETP